MPASCPGGGQYITHTRAAWFGPPVPWHSLCVVERVELNLQRQGTVTEPWRSR
jgi:hypothetical protein